MIPPGTLALPGPGPLAAWHDRWRPGAAAPSEAIAITVANLDLPAVDGDGDGWGWLILSRSDADVASTWSDGGRRVARQLKHRAEDTVRPVPAPSPLVEHLRAHLAEHGTAEDGRLFRGAYGARVSTASYAQVWDAARRQALGLSEYAGPLARRPYDLRHTAVSTWLAAGVDSTQVAAWAGHSVAVLHRVYAHTISGRDSTARARMAQVLGITPQVSDDDATERRRMRPGLELAAPAQQGLRLWSRLGRGIRCLWSHHYVG